MEEKPNGVPLLKAETDQAYTEYVTAVGQVAYNWNALHEQLGLLFVEVTGTRLSVGMGIWYAIQSDRLQGTILKAAVGARNIEDPLWTPHTAAAGDIEWLADQVSNSLSDRRNNAIHAPAEVHLVMLATKEGEMVRGGIEIGPAYFYGNPRATRLKGKELIKEFEWYAACAQTYCRYAEAMVSALSVSESTWPNRPQVPLLGQSLD